MIKDLNFIKYIINYFSDMPKLLRGLDIDIPFNGSVYCPFHENYNTPAAKVYKDASGYCLFCFNEHRIYKSFDIIKDLYNYNVYDVFNYIWSSLSDKDKQYFIDSFGEMDTDIITVPCLDALDAFRLGRISYKVLLEEILKKY